MYSVMKNTMAEECLECEGIEKICTKISLKCHGTSEVITHSHMHRHGSTNHDHPHQYPKGHLLDDKNVKHELEQKM